MDPNDLNHTGYSFQNGGLPKRSPSSFSFRSYEEQEEFLPYESSRLSLLRRRIVCQFLWCFRQSLLFFRPVLIVFFFYLSLRTFHEFNILMLNYYEQQSLYNTYNHVQSEVRVPDDSSLRVFSDRLDRELRDIHAERDRIAKMISKIQSDCASSMESFQMSIQGVQNQGNLEQHMDALRNLIVDEYEALRIQRIGKPDYALKELGARVVDHSPTYSYGSHVTRFVGIPLFWTPKTPDVLLSKLSDSVVPGECWPFQGGQGFVLIELSRSINVSSVSYEHASTRLLPPDELWNAPKLINVWVGETPMAGRGIGTIRYEPRDYGAQTLYLKNEVPARFVKLYVVENYGAKFTCLYRIRVHGTPVEPLHDPLLQSFDEK